VDRGEHIQCFDLHQEVVRLLLVVEAAKIIVRVLNTTRRLEIADA